MTLFDFFCLKIYPGFQLKTKFVEAVNPEAVAVELA